MSVSKPRILLYSHDTYGLGHLRRNLAIAHQLAGQISGVHQLLLTGSMVAGAYSLPPRFDMVKLPALSKRSSGAYKARTLPLTLNNTIAWREQIILQAVLNFNPDVVIVDKAPAGVCNEMLPALRHLKTWSPQTKLVFGLRDIEDSAAITREQWNRQDAYALFDDVYDVILHYGQRELFDPVSAYALSERAAAKLIETGYIAPPLPKKDTGWVRNQLDIGDLPLLVVTVGGGGDGFDIVHTFLEMLHEWPQPPFHAVVVAGPLMAQRKQRVARTAANHPNVTLIDFTPDLLDYLDAADVVISMAGYNTTFELMALGKRTILIPRQRVRHEQRLRAELLARRGVVQHLPLSRLTGARLRKKILQALDAPQPQIDLNLNGLEAVGSAVAQLLQQTPRKRRTVSRKQYAGAIQ